MATAKRTWKKWTLGDDELLKRYIDEGKSTEAIAKALRRTRRSVTNRATQLGLHIRKPSSWRPDEDALLKKLLGEGKTARVVARIMGRTPRSVYCRKYALGLHRCSTSYKFSPRNPLLLAEIIKFKMAGWTLKEIGKVYGGDAGDISNVLCENGFKGFLWQRPKHRENYRFWTDTEVSLLRIYLQSGMSYAQIHEKLPDRTVAAIKRKAAEVRHSPSPPLMFHQASRRTPAELNQEVRDSLFEYPHKPDAWHAERIGAQEFDTFCKKKEAGIPPQPEGWGLRFPED